MADTIIDDVLGAYGRISGEVMSLVKEVERLRAAATHVRAKALEEAARECDAYTQRTINLANERHAGGFDAAQELAKLIRERKTKPIPPTPDR
jgi:hypothetical protein